MINASIVTYHTDLDELGKCVDCLLASDLIREVSIVDNGREDHIARWVDMRNDPRLTYIPADNRGYGAGHNLALSRSCSNDGPEAVAYHLVINSDVYFEPGTLEVLVKEMEADRSIAQVIPRVIYPDGATQHVARLLPTPFDVFVRRFVPEWLFAKRRRRYTLTLGHEHTVIDSPYLLGSFMLLQTEALRQTGTFDERFFMYPEDIDLTRRLHRNFRTLYLPTVTIVHAHRAASYHNLKMTRIHVANMIRYFNKWGWFCDAERRRMNRRVLNELNHND